MAFISLSLGATECGLVRQFFIDHEMPLVDGVVPIGYPVEDMSVQVLDQVGRPLGVGEVGEIAVRSRYLALGYYERPDLTASAFEPDPSDPGAPNLPHRGWVDLAAVILVTRTP